MLKKLKITFDWDTRVQEEDKKFVQELYLILLSCPDQLIESAKLSAFFENLLTTNHTLETIVAATMHNIQPKASDNNIKNFTSIIEWYRRLDKRYNLSLTAALVPLMTTENLNKLSNLQPPFLENYDSVDNAKLYDNEAEITQGKSRNLRILYIILHCQGRTHFK